MPRNERTDPDPTFLAATPARVSRFAAGLGLAAAVLVLALAVWQWQRDAQSLTGRGTRLNLPTTVGSALYLGDVANGRSAGHHAIDIRSLRPRIVANTADATVSFWICRSESRLGSATAELVNQLCASLTPFSPGRLDVGGATTDQLLAAVIPRQAGMIRIDGFDVHYRDGLRSARQHTGDDVLATAHLPAEGGTTVRAAPR